MKRISIILMAFAMVLTMAQCKKNERTNPSETVTITFDAKRSNGSKVDVNTATGTVDFETGDKVYVGSGGKYVGFLTHNGSKFVGNITNPTEGQPLQFYFLGNVTPAETLAAGTTEYCSVVISDQTEHLPVISCAASYENYVSGVTSYTGHLLNKCALVKFNVTTPSNSPICITGMNNKATVNFSQNTVTPSQDGEGVIKLPAGSGENVEKWAILLPQEALEEGEEGSVYSADAVYLGIRPAIPTISENGYLANGIAIFVTTSGIPIGAVKGLFSVSSTKQVYFSKGNLQYIGSASTPHWQFAENQWDYIGSFNGSTFSNVDRDLFGWGTSGYNHGAICYQPWDMNTSNGSYYAYGNPSYNLFHQTGKADWGYNAIYNGGNTENQWRTLTAQEWNYVFYTRNTTSGILWVRASVNGIPGVVLLPDNWNSSIYSFSNGSGYNSNNITRNDWLNILEANGAVFLPAAGRRTLNSWGDNLEGYYWSATVYQQETAYYTWITSNTVYNTYQSRYVGHSVRLVQDY